MATRIPENFSVTEQHRQYCAERWGYPFLADAFLSEFIEYWTDGNGKGKRHVNWDRTFTNWIRRSSPLETKYLGKWEKMIDKAKNLEGRSRQRVERYDPAERPPEPSMHTISELGRSYLQKAKEALS